MITTPDRSASARTKLSVSLTAAIVAGSIAAAGGAIRAAPLIGWDTLAVVYCGWHAPAGTPREVLVGATFIGLGYVGGAALPFVWVYAGLAAFALMLAGGLLGILAALLY